jgi:hypothetical protein
MNHHYRFYNLDQHGRIFRAEGAACADDLDALAKAKEFSAKAEVEIWQAARRVGRIKIGDADLNERDRSSL